MPLEHLVIKFEIASNGIRKIRRIYNNSNGNKYFCLYMLSLFVAYIILLLLPAQCQV